MWNKLIPFSYTSLVSAKQFLVVCTCLAVSVTHFDPFSCSANPVTGERRRILYRRQIFFPETPQVPLISLPPPQLRSSPNPNPNCPVNTPLFHSGEKKCYQIGVIGPCENNLRFFPSKLRRGHGICDCVAHKKGLPTIYHKPTNKCYSIYNQAYCRKHQWLVFTSQTRVQCVQNFCSKSSMKLPVVLDGKCVELGSNCTNGNDSENTTIGFKIGDRAARCDVFLPPDSGESSLEWIATRTLSVSNILGCGMGFILDSQGHCQEIVSFE